MTIGLDIPRIDGLAKLSGHAKYVDDLAIPGVLHGGTVRTPIARGRIKRIVFDPAIDWSEFVIVDHRDIPGPNAIAMIENDWPALVADEFRHKHQAVVLLAHRSMSKLRAALRAVKVEVEPLPALLDPMLPPTPELIQHNDDNVFKRIDIRKGDPRSVFGSAPHVIAGEYRTGAQEHVYIEPHGMAAYAEGGRLVLAGSMQCPYYVLNAMTHLFGRPPEAFRIVQTPTGGGFGGKEDYPSLLAVHAALLSEKAGAPVKIIYERHEDMIATTKRHPSVVRHRTAVDSDGRLLAMEIEMVLDSGAYVTLSPVVLSRGCIHAAGPYNCDHVHIHGEARLTNSPPYGAFRGFGAPQSLFAVERHMDEIAKRIGMDPVELRRRNLLKPGQTTATEQVYRDTTDQVALMDQALAAIQYEQRNKVHAEFNRTHPYLRRGVGFATFYHGAGFTGAGEVYLASEVTIEALPDGRVEVLTAQTDIGQGTVTILTQIAADTLDIDVDRVSLATPDTSRVPNSGPTVASRTAMVVGRLVQRACEDLLEKLGCRSSVADREGSNPLPFQGGDGGGSAQQTSDAANPPVVPPKRGDGQEGHPLDEDLRAAIQGWHAAHPGERLLGFAKYEKPPEIQWDEEAYRGDAYATYAYATYAAEVEVDLRTYSTRVTDFVAHQEVGRVLNPTLATGQIQGGVAQGIGWALLEDVQLEDGAMANPQMTNYIIPTSSDLPAIRVHFDEQPAAYGPRGAKGIGELPMDGPAPAVINAVCRALGVSVDTIPLTPERLHAVLLTAEAQRAQRSQRKA